MSSLHVDLKNNKKITRTSLCGYKSGPISVITLLSVFPERACWCILGWFKKKQPNILTAYGSCCQHNFQNIFSLFRSVCDYTNLRYLWYVFVGGNKPYWFKHAVTFWVVILHWHGHLHFPCCYTASLPSVHTASTHALFGHDFLNPRCFIDISQHQSAPLHMNPSISFIQLTVPSISTSMTNIFTSAKEVTLLNIYLLVWKKITAFTHVQQQWTVSVIQWLVSLSINPKDQEVEPT